MTYYEYIGARKFNETLGALSRKERVSKVNGFLRESGQVENVDHTKVWLNLFPINIYTVKPASEAAA
jgi:hypothetical protein